MKPIPRSKFRMFGGCYVKKVVLGIRFVDLRESDFLLVNIHWNWLRERERGLRSKYPARILLYYSEIKVAYLRTLDELA